MVSVHENTGYKKNNINIKISEDGSKISISGEKPVQNIVMMGWLMHRKEVDVAGFNKVFKIPDGVKLDGIKAKYDEEEWTMNIIMPKLVKGICGAKIEEVKEEESNGRRRRSEQEKSEGDHIPTAVGETSQKGSKESEVQAMEDSENSMEKKAEVSKKKLDDFNRKIIKDTVYKEVEESKVGTDGGNGDSFGDFGKEGYEVVKTPEPERKVGVGTSQKIGETSLKEMEELKLKNEDGRVKGTREEVGKTAYEAVKTLEKGKSVGEGMTQNIGGDKRLEKGKSGGFVEKEKGVSENMLDDGNANIIGEVIQKEKEAKSGIKDRDGESVKEKNVRAGYKGMKTSEIEQNVGAHVTQNFGDTIQGVSKESVTEQMGESKSIVEKMEREEPGEMLVEANEGETLGESNQKQFGEPRSETEDRLKESVKESRMETMKAPQLDQNVDDQIPTNIGGISQEEFKESRIQWKEKTESIKENMGGGKSEKTPIQASKDGKKHILGKNIQDNIKKPKIEIGNGDQEYDGVKAGKEEFDSMGTIREEFPPKLPKGTTEESKRLSISKMHEIEDVEEAKIKRKLKEHEYSVHKDEGEELRRMHKAAKKDLAKETLRENEDIKEEMDIRDGTEIDYSVDKSEGEEHKRRHTEAKKDLIKETMKKNETAMDKREDREIEDFLEARKDLTKKIQETEDIKEEMSKRKDEEIEKFVDKGKGKEPTRLYVEAKDLRKETIQESEDIQEAMLKREGKNNEHFGDKLGEKPKSMHMEAKKNVAEEKMQETEGVKEAIFKRKEEIGNFTYKDEGEEATKMLMNAKKELTKETKQENEKVREVMVKRKDKETEHFVDKGEPKSMHVEAKKDLTTKTIRESEHVREAMVKREAKGSEYFVDKGEESKRMHMELKKDISQETIQEPEGVQEAMIKRKGKDIENFADKEGEEHRKVIVKAKKVSTKEANQEGEKDKEAMVKWKSQETEEDFTNRGEEEEPKSLHMEVKKDPTVETIQEREEVKGEGKDYEYFVDKGVSESKGMHIEPKKDIAKEKLHEIVGFKEAMVNIKGKEIENFVDKEEGEEHKKINVKLKKESTKEKKQVCENVKEAIVKRKGNETKYFVGKSEGEEPKSTHVEAKKELTADTTQDVREGTDYECFVDKGEDEETKRMLMEPKNIAKETMQEIEGVKEAMVKRKGKEIENLADKDEAGELTKMLLKSKKELTKETKQQSEKIKEAMVKRKGKETEYFVDKGEDKEQKRMYVEAKKDLTTNTTQESEDVIEATVKRDGKGCGYFVNKGESEEPKRMHMEPKKDITKETMPKTGVKEAMVKTKDKEIGNFAGKCEGEEHMIILIKDRKELLKGPKKERENFKETMVKKKGKETEYFGDKGEDEEPINMYVEAEKDLTSKTIQEGEDVKEAVIETEGKDYEYFVDKGEGEELKMTNMEAKKNIGKESMYETKGAKEAMAKRKDKEIGSFAKGEGKETKKVHVEAKKDLTTMTVQESDGTNEGNENKCFLDEIEGEEANKIYMETNKDFREETSHESENVKKVKVKSEGKDIECFEDKSEDKESIRMLMGTKRDLTKEEMHENDDVKEAMIKRKGKEIESFVDNSEGEVEEPRRMHVEEKKDLTTKTLHEIEDAKEAMIKSKDKEIENFADKAKGKESKITEAKKDSTKVTMKESDDTKEAMVKRKGKEVENFVDRREEPKWMHTEAKKDLTTKTIEESEVGREAMVKREGEEQMDYFLEKGEDEKDITKEKIQIVEKIKHGITDNDQQNVLGKSEVPTEEVPKLVGAQDGSRGLKVSNMEDPKEIMKEEMAETESLMEKVHGEKSKKSEEASRVIQKNTATEILHKETEESNNERKSREGQNVSHNIVKVVFEVLGTFQAKLPQQVMEAIVQNNKDKNEYVIVKLKGEGSIKLHVEPNEAFDEDETHERSEKEVRKPKLKSSDQISGKENVDFGVFDRSKRPKFLEMGETQDKYPEELEMESPDRELQSTKGQTTSAKVASGGFKELEQDSAKDKAEKTKLLPSKIQSKGIHESEKGVKQDTIKPKKEKGEQCTYNIGSNEEIARFPSTQQTKVGGNDKLYEGGKAQASTESQKEGPTKDTRNLIEMKENQGSKQRKTLKSEIPMEILLKKEGKKEEGSPMPTASQRKELRELSLPSKDYKIPKIEEVQQKREGKRPMHALEATTSKEGELAQAIATHSKAKSEIDEQQVNPLPSPSIKMRSIDPRELEKHGLKEDGSKAVSLDHMQEGKEFIHSIDSAAASEVVADKAAEPSKFPSLSSSQPFEVEGKDKIDASCDDESQDSDMDSKDGEASTKGETDEEAVQRETLQPESPEDQQCTHKALEESHGTHEIEEEKADEQVDEADQEDSQQLEEQTEAVEGKKDQKRSKKLIVSTIIAGSALLASGIFLIIRHRRSRKG